MHAYRTHTCGELRKDDVGQDRPALRLGAPHARPWRAAVHRSARPLRHHPMRGRAGIAGLRRRPRALSPNGWCASTARWWRARPRPSIPICRPARSSSGSARIEVLSEAEELPLPVFGEPDYPEETRLKYRFLDLRRERLHKNIMLRAGDHLVDPPAHDRAGLHRVPDADPDRVLAGRRARLPGAVARSIPASSTRCRRRRSNSSS